MASGAGSASLIALNRPESKEYLSNLTTLSLPQLHDEPTTLQTQSHHLTSSLTSLTHTSYPTFLSLHRTTTALTGSLESLASSLSALLDHSLPALEDSATNWKDRTEHVLRERGRAKVVLDQHDKIRDLLDIPLLIDACVRNGYFAEALSLASHAKSLSASSSPPLILQSVLSEVHNSVTQMLLSLLATLYEPNRKLPALWKAVNFLRKMDGFGPTSPLAPLSSRSKIEVLLAAEDTIDRQEEITSEEQLALAFLIGRETCLESTLETSGNDVTRLTKDRERILEDREKEDLARYLKSYIDAWREGTYDIITQFTTIFLERSSTTTISRNGPNPPSSSKSEKEILRLHSLITTYASHALNAHLLPILSPALPKLSLALLPSLLTQLTYCSTAFARVGLDFRSLLSIMFADAILQVVSNDLHQAASKWNSRLQKAARSPPPPSASGMMSPILRERRPIATSPSKWVITPAAAASPPSPVATTTFPAPPSLSSSEGTDGVTSTERNPEANGSSSTSGGSSEPTASQSKAPQPQGPAHIPPQMLASYPPLAEHTNALLGVFNNLRLLAPTSILGDLVIVVDDVLAEGGEALLEYLQAVAGNLGLSTGVTEDEVEKRARERRIAKAFGEVYFRVFVPFVQRALVEGVYGASVTPRKGDAERERKLDTQIQQWDQLKSEALEGSA